MLGDGKQPLHLTHIPYYFTLVMLAVDHRSPLVPEPTWGAGAADVQRVVQLGHRVLDDVLRLAHRPLEQRELLLQELLLQLLLATGLQHKPHF